MSVGEPIRRTFRGVPVSPGFGLAPLSILDSREIPIPSRPAEDTASELALLEEALGSVRGDVEALREKTSAEAGEEAAEIFDTYLSLLQDDEFLHPVREGIRKERLNAAFAVDREIRKIADLFSSMENEYMRERAADFRDVAARLIRKILGVKPPSFEETSGPRVISSGDLTPSDTADLKVSDVSAIVTEKGGRTSHAAILARTMGIPAVVGVRGFLRDLKDGDMVLVNGNTGDVIVAPTPEEIETYEAAKRTWTAGRAELTQYRDRSTSTRNGTRLKIMANIGTPRDISSALENGAEGVGLFRSEFLFMDRAEAPNEDEQFEAYASVLRGMGSKPVIVRTLDVGGDKDIPYLKLPKEKNPFLGLRAIRLCFEREVIFTTQLRALLRASPFGNLRIMFPMIASLEELRRAKGYLEATKKRLSSEGVPFSDSVKVGMMIEIPSAAVMAESFARECDFFSIGTNDLVQYTTASDRENEKLSRIHSPYQPAVLRLIERTVRAAHAAGIECGICGEAAADLGLVPVFVGFGIGELSMNAGSILETRKRISELDSREEEKRVADLLSLATEEEVRNRCDSERRG